MAEHAERNAGTHVTDSPRRFLVIRWSVGLVAAALIGLQSAWGEGPEPLQAASGLATWLLLSSIAVGWIPGASRLLGLALFGDAAAAAVVVYSSGSLHSPALLLLALPVLAGGLIYHWRVGFLLGLFTALLYALIALGQSRLGMLPGELWVRVIFHTAFFSCMGIAAGLLAKRMASSLREAAATRSELEAVRMSTDRIVDSLSCGLLTVDASGEVRCRNPEARRLLNLDAEAEQIPAPVRDGNTDLFAMLEAGSRGEPRSLDAEWSLMDATGHRFPAWVKVTPVIDIQGQTRGLVALFWDLTERKQLEELARRRERLATVGELSAGLAHEIRNSLKPITGSIEMLQARNHLPPDIDPVMEMITREADSLEAFLSQFLALARDKTLKLEQIDIEDLISREVEAIKVGRSWQARSVAISSHAEVGVQGDREWLRQVFRNLILNAFEATAKGQIEVRLERFARDQQRWVRVRIADEGPGLGDMGDREPFQPFRTTKPGGTGLGLSIAQRGVEEHGGKIAFDRSRSRGACVVVELPETAARPSLGTDRAAA